ncbi:MAG: carbonic anhydrase [Deltaproteobacteria bacterium]|nr:carbonic anhydrase [Nannocystaceae bacterium]
MTVPVPHSEALARLRAGNDRFFGNLRSVDSMATKAQRDGLVAGQTPFAIVLSCSDSRVPAEIVFDCGLGDLFVVRVAGNVVAPSIVGSVEFAAATFGTELVVVMGHTRCGAVGATIDTLRGGPAPHSENIRDIVDRIAPSITEIVRSRPADEDTVRAAIRANVRASANHLRHGSRVLEQRITEHRLAVVGAEYELETGKVEFFDGADG